MPIYYVAALARYVLVQAENEAEARERGQSALNEQNASAEIRTVRLATRMRSSSPSGMTTLGSPERRSGFLQGRLAFDA
jgi:hypothetical protein